MSKRFRAFIHFCGGLNCAFAITDPDIMAYGSTVLYMAFLIALTYADNKWPQGDR